MSLRVIPRHEWGARAPLGSPMTLPVGEANLHHSVTALTADPLADMRAIERIGIERFGRFSYSWAYHRPARVWLEGAGDTIGAHTAGRNSSSLGIVLIGNYDVTPLDDIGVADLGAGLRWLITTGRLTEDFRLRGHRDHKATACPGRHAYARLGDIRAAARNPLPEDDMPLTDDDVRRVAQAVWHYKVHHLGDSRQPATLVVRDIATHARAGARSIDTASLAAALAQRLPGTSGPVKVADLETALRNVLGSLND